MLRLQRISEPVNLDRCNTLITECRGGLPRPHLAGRANSTALAWRRRAAPKSRGSQSLRVSHMSARGMECVRFAFSLGGVVLSWSCAKRYAFAFPTEAEALLHE
eukprot:2482376-Amphidinium_carterae.1